MYEDKGLIIRTRGIIQLVRKSGFWERRAKRKHQEKMQKARIELAPALMGLKLIGIADDRPEIEYIVEYMTKALNEDKLPDLKELTARLKREFKE